MARGTEYIMNVLTAWMATEREAWETHYPYAHPKKALWFSTVDQLMRAVTSSGSHFFSPDTMRFFKCRVSDTLIDGRFFVTSERNGDDLCRYNVRYVYQAPRSEGLRLSVERVGEMGQFRTLDQAKRAAQLLVTLTS